MIKTGLLLCVLMSSLLADEVNSILVNPDGKIGLNVTDSEVIPSEVDILLKGRTKSDGVFQLPVANKNPDNPEDGMVYVHTSGEVRYFVSGSWYKLSTEALPAPLKAETGSLMVNTTFQTVSLTESYISPVIITTPVSTRNNVPVVVRLNQVSGSEFEIKLQRIDGLSDPLAAPLMVHYVVVEEGTYNVAEHGVKMEARKVSSTVVDKTNSWNAQALAYSQVYDTPVVLGQVMSYENEHFSQFWCRGSSAANPPSSGILNVGKHTFSVTSDITEPETLGVIVIESGSGAIADLNYHCGVGSDIILGVGNNGNYIYEMPYSVASGIVSQVAMDGGDGGIATFKENPQGQSVLKVLIDEDMIVDAERNHTHEQAAFLVFQ